MIRIGVPSKGRLMEDTFAWFARARPADAAVGGGAGVFRHRRPAGGAAGVPVGRGNPARAGGGRIHLGVTGSDLVREQLGEDEVEELARLGFGQADLIIAVPAVWIDVETVDDLDAAAAAFRAAHGFRLRIATKYHRLVREFLQAQGVADYQLVDSQGATEGTVKNGTAEAIADITSSGETLRANHLRVLSDGLIHASEAVLWSSRKAEWTGEDRAAMGRLSALLGVRGPQG